MSDSYRGHVDPSERAHRSNATSCLLLDYQKKRFLLVSFRRLVLTAATDRLSMRRYHPMNTSLLRLNVNGRRIDIRSSTVNSRSAATVRTGSWYR